VAHEQHIDEYYQLAVSAEWGLRLSVLLQLGIDAEILHQRLQDHQKFHFALANMDRCTHAWPGWRLEEFGSRLLLMPPVLMGDYRPIARATNSE
jgi:hypothetical protein